MPKTIVQVGPKDHGRRMSLEEFDLADGRDGHLYDLHRGVIVVVDVPDARHFAQVDALDLQLAAYRLANPGRIHRVGGGAECKIVLHDEETERHPDLALYLTPPPPGANIWARWIPEIGIEVVSPSSVRRDYDEKPDEYLRVGVREYWIVDADRQEVLVLRRRGQRWVRKTVRPPDLYRTPLLSRFELACGLVFKAAEATR